MSCSTTGISSISSALKPNTGFLPSSAKRKSAPLEQLSESLSSLS
jgi:hypothetical protein